VIELWLAARNEPELGSAIQSSILRIRDLANPQLNPRLLRVLGKSPKALSLYRLSLEIMIWMALGRAVTPGTGLLVVDAADRLLRAAEEHLSAAERDERKHTERRSAHR